MIFFVCSLIILLIFQSLSLSLGVNRPLHRAKAYVKATHFLDICSGGYKGGVPNSLNFMQFLGKVGKISCWRPLEDWCPHLGEILDLPLICCQSLH